MPVTLNNPLETVTLDKARIAKFSIENNAFKGQRWVEIWVVLGRFVDGEWEEWSDPRTGHEAIYFKIENNKHPLSPDARLDGYDGFTRLMGSVPGGSSFSAAMKIALYSFLLSETVAHPETGEPTKLLDATP